MQSFARSRSLPAALCNRAGFVPASAEGELNNAIAARLKMTKQTVSKWRTGFIDRRIAGMYDDVRPGRPRTIDDERVAHPIKTILHTKRANESTHGAYARWPPREGLNKSTDHSTRR